MEVKKSLIMPLVEARHAGYMVERKKILDDLNFSIREGASLDEVERNQG